MDIQTLLQELQSFAPTLVAAEAAYNPKTAAEIQAGLAVVQLGEQLAEKFAAIRAKTDVDPVLMEQVAQANRDADAQL